MGKRYIRDSAQHSAGVLPVVSALCLSWKVDTEPKSSEHRREEEGEEENSLLLLPL